MRAFFVIGPESSGTRMVTDSFIRAGAFGQAGHSQEMDDLCFTGRPEMIVFRRSVPHGDLWPDITRIVRRMAEAGYVVSPVVTYRDKDYCVRSQLRVGHQETEAGARSNYYLAYKHIFKHLTASGLLPAVCHYSSFVNDAEYRRLFFAQFSLVSPDMQLFDANKKYPDALGPSADVAGATSPS